LPFQPVISIARRGAVRIETAGVKPGHDNQAIGA